MSVFDEQPPIINKNNLIKWLKSNYSFLRSNTIRLIKFNSERDINFLISINKNKKYVLKISNPLEELSTLKYQDNLINHLRKNKNLQKYIPKICHLKINKYLDVKNRKCFVRMLTFIEGKLYGDIKSNDDIEKSLGKLLAETSIQLKTFFDKRAFRQFVWDPSKIDWINKEIIFFTGFEKNILLRTYDEYKRFIKSNLKNLRYSITHSDPNNYNLVIKNNKVG